MLPWHTLSVEDALARQKSVLSGLSVQEAVERLVLYGKNALPETKPPSLIETFVGQFQSPLIYVLLAAAAAVFAMGETVDGAIIVAVLFFNAVVGTIQEGRAQNTLMALRRYVETNATVLRDGEEIIIPDSEVVPGDILLLHEGERVPADGRVIHSQSLKVDEASMTGESEPTFKHTDILPDQSLAPADQKNMVFKGTHVVAGNARVLAVATGPLTVIGSIAQKISEVDQEIPLKENIRYLSRAIIVLVFVVSVILFAVGLLQGHSAREMFTTIVSLTVSVIPEGLPVVLTLVLATGVWRMSRQHVLVKKLQAVEALGQARIIAVDKTGTITKNELLISRVWTGGELFEVSGTGYEAKGAVTHGSAAPSPGAQENLMLMAHAAAVSAGARVSFVETEGRYQVAGDPTEAAMLVFAEKLGVVRDTVLETSPVLGELPFDYKRKYHAVVTGTSEVHELVVSGAFEVVLGACTHVAHDGIEVLSAKLRTELNEHFNRLSAEGLRVIAIATKPSAHVPPQHEDVHGLTLLGFFGMQDSVRSEVKDAMELARAAGIRVVMITGDHVITAKAIAQSAGIYREGDAVMTGEELEKLYDAELKERLATVTVFARVTPEHKMLIINAYKLRGETVAMTGDGVNDAPSLVAAHLGVAMGKIGTEVAKEASDIVLMDDNFGSIVAAVEEGRSIYKTIKKVILYLFSTNAGEVLTISGALFLGYPLPILPAQIIWLNFVTDGFLDVSLAMEPKEKGLLKGSFAKPSRYIIDRLMSVRMTLMATTMMLGTLYLFSQYYATDLTHAWSVSLTTLAMFQWFNAWNCRSETQSMFSRGIFANKFLLAATAFIVVLHLAALYTPVLQDILKTEPLTLAEWGLIVPIAFSIVVVEEVRKFVYRRRGW